MTESFLLRDLGIILVAGAALSLLGRLVRVPAIVAYIAAGLLLGPVIGAVEVTGTLEVISETGVALLLFLVGLELSLDRVRDVGGVALGAGFLQVGLTWAGGVALSLALGLEAIPAAVVGLAVAFSSTAVVVKLLEERRELQAEHGRISVGILLVQDLVVIVSLTLLAGLSGGDGGGHAGGASAGGLGAGGIAARLGRALLGMGVLITVAAVAARRLLPRLFGWVAGERDTLFVWSLTWCFLLILGAEAFHLSPEMGAFLAGLALAQLPVAHDLYRRVAPLTNFFLAVFFVSLGVRMDPGAAADEPALVAALALFVLVGKGSLIAWLLARMGRSEETAFRTGVTLAQASEFSFILVALAVAADLMSPGLASAVGVAGLVTIAVSTYGILGSDGLYRRLRGGRLLGLLGAPPPAEAVGTGAAELLSGHVIVVGMNLLGRTLVRRLAGAGRSVAAVDTDPRKLEDLPAPAIHGDVLDPSVLEEAGLSRARLLVSALRIEDVNVVLAHRCRKAGIACSIHAFDPSVVERLQEAGADHLIVARDEGTRKVFQRLRELGAVG